jgi:enolase
VRPRRPRATSSASRSSLALDVAANELYKDGVYTFGGVQMTSAEVVEHYAGWCERFPLLSIEDGAR